MDWLSEDWEYPNDHIYAMEREKDIVNSWHKWEEEHDAKNRKPAIIKIEKLDEANCNTRTIRRAHQERL